MRARSACHPSITVSPGGTTGDQSQSHPGYIAGGSPPHVKQISSPRLRSWPLTQRRPIGLAVGSGAVEPPTRRAARPQEQLQTCVKSFSQYNSETGRSLRQFGQRRTREASSVITRYRLSSVVVTLCRSLTTAQPARKISAAWNADEPNLTRRIVKHDVEVPIGQIDCAVKLLKRSFQPGECKEALVVASAQRARLRRINLERVSDQPVN